MECAIDPTNPSIMYSELYYGDIAISTNGGQIGIILLLTVMEHGLHPMRLTKIILTE